MKKLIVVFIVFFFTTATKVSAQQFVARLTTRGGFTEGANTMIVTEGKGTIKFVKKGDSYSDVIFTDNKGKANRLSAVNPCSNTAVQTACEGFTEACFATPDKKVNIYFCRSAKLSGTTSRQTTITIAL